MKIQLKIFLFCLASSVFIGCDRVTKDLAKEHLMNRESSSYFHDTFRLIYAENIGAALNLGEDLPRLLNFWLLSILPLILLMILFVYAISKSGRFSMIKMFCFSLIFAGGIGNILDRIFFDRHVTDFMNLGIHNFRTGIFNFADVCVTAGVIGLLFFNKDRKSKQKAVISE